MIFPQLSTLAVLATCITFTSAQTDVGLKKCAKKKWAMTFDDGPSSLTPQLLSVLKAEKVKATFYILGSQLEDPALAAHTLQAFKDGHQIASHTTTHTVLSTLPAAGMIKEMKDTEVLLEKIIGKIPNYMRPPTGECNALCVATMKSLGYTITQWNVDSRDWEIAEGPESSWRKIVENMKRYEDGNGALIKASDPDGIISLQHDINKPSVGFTQEIIKNIKALGFTFSTVAECGDPAEKRPPPYRLAKAPANGTNLTTGPGKTPVKPATAPITNNAVKGDASHPLAGAITWGIPTVMAAATIGASFL